MVDGVEIIGRHEQAVGIEATGTMQITITRVNIRQALHGVHLTTHNRNVIVSNCHLYENRGVGLFLDHVNLHQINVTGSHISYNAGGGIVNRGGNVRNLHVAGCDIEANMGLDETKYPPTANVLLDSTDAAFDIGEVAITGCTIQHTHNAPGAANIRISDSIIRNDRGGRQSWLALKAIGGANNMIVDNALGGRLDVDPKTAHLAGNITKLGSELD